MFENQTRENLIKRLVLNDKKINEIIKSIKKRRYRRTQDKALEEEQKKVLKTIEDKVGEKDEQRRFRQLEK